jgi:hypothetical protein
MNYARDLRVYPQRVVPGVLYAIPLTKPVPPVRVRVRVRPPVPQGLPLQIPI